MFCKHCPRLQMPVESKSVSTQGRGLFYSSGSKTQVTGHCATDKCNVDLGLVLIARKLFVTQKLIQNLQCCFQITNSFLAISQHKSQAESAPVPSQHCIGGRGGGGGGGGVGRSSDCQGMWPEISHFSHLSYSKTKLSNIADL